MAGHSKWKNIQYRKGAQDARRGKLFTKFIREITQSTRLFGPDPAANPRLRAVVDKALTANMSRDTIDNAIKRGISSADSAQMEELTYEGYGPGGVAVYIECMTDNRNRTVAEIRHAFTKCGGNLGTDGSVAYLFTKKGQLGFPAGCDEDKIMEIALETGAEDVIMHDDKTLEILTTPDTFNDVKAALAVEGFSFEAAEITYLPATYSRIDNQELAEKMLKLLDMLEDLDDVQNFYSNADIAADVLAQLA